MLISKEENITQITDKIKLSTFTPQKGQTIFITFRSLNDYTPEECSRIMEVVEFMFPENNVMCKFDNITLEAMYEDDLK